MRTNLRSTPAPLTVGARSSAARAATLLLVLLVTFALIAGQSPTAFASPAQPTAPTGPTGPTSASQPTSTVTTDSCAVRIVSPTVGALVSGRPLRAKVWTVSGARGFTATLDGRVVTSSFHRSGHYWLGTVPRVRGGVNTLDVGVVVRGKKKRAFSQITVQGRHRDLVRVVRPHSGLLTGATDPGVKPIAVRIDPSSTATARLNGKPVTLPAPEVGSVRSFLLSRRDGLRRGQNTFVVQAYRTNGQWDSSTTRFTVDRSTPLAEAGGNVLARQGDTVSLDGSGSLPGSSSAQLSYQWRLVEAPVGFTALPTAADGATSSLKLTTPGKYLVKLSVTQQNGYRVLRSSDLLSIDTLAGAPPVGQRLVTLADDPSGKTSGPGLLLGNDWYPWSKYFGSATAGVFAYNPRSLTSPVVNGTPLLPAALSSPNPDNDIKTFLGKTPPGTILIFVGLDGCCSASSWFPHSGAFSHIVAYSGGTVPGNLGDGAWNRGAQLSDGLRPLGPSGSLSGYLRYQTGLAQPGQDGSNDGRAGGFFRFVQDDNVPFDTSAPNIATTGATDGATYRLSAASDPTKSVGRPGASDTPLLLQAPSADPAQQWQLVRAYGSFYRLVSRLDGRCMDVNGGDGVTVGAYGCDPNGADQPNQLWLPTWNADGHGWVLRSGLTPDATTVKVLTRTDAGGLVLHDDNAIANQAWTFDLAPGVYTITSRVNAKAVGEPDYAAKDGAQLVTSPLTSELNQQWRLLDRPGQSVALQNLASHLCLDVAGSCSAEGAAVVDTACSDDRSSQRWTAAPSSDGLYLKSVASGLDLSADGTGNLVQVAYDDRSPQPPVWNLNRQPDPVLNGYYAVSSASTGRTVQAVGTGVSARPAAASTANQNWTLREAWKDSPNQGLVMLVNERTGQCLNKTSDSPFANPIAVGPGPCAFWDDSPESTWRRVVNADGTYTLQTIDTPNAPLRKLTVADDGTLSGTESTGADNQKWLFAGRPITFQVGQHRYSTSLPTGGSGFAVMASDEAVRPVAGYPRVFLTNGSGDSGADQTDLGNALKKLGGTPGTTVLLQSAGRPRPNTAAWNTIADGVAAIGGRRPLLLQLDGTGDFATVGCAGCPEATQPTYSESVSRTVDPTVVGARLEGTLTRDGSTLEAAQTTAAIVDDTFADLANRATTPWPFSNPDDPGYPVLAALSSKLKLPDTCGSSAGLDPVRAAYCLWQDQEEVGWTAESQALDKLQLSDISGSMTKPVSEATFEQVKAQLEIEFGQLPKVHTMLKGQTEIYQSAVYQKGNATQLVAQNIKNDMLGRKQTSKDIAGGVFDVLSDTYHLLKPLAPLVLASPHAPSADEPDNPVPDMAESTVALIKDIVKLAGDNEDSSKGVGLHIDTDAQAYASQMDAQYGQVIANISTVENIIVTDPVKLAVAAANSTNTWEVPLDRANQQVSALVDGVVRDTWIHLMPTVYEMWQWTTSYYNTIDVAQIACYKANPLPSWHHIYTGQDSRGVFRLTTRVDANGRVATADVDILTAATDPDLTHDVNRVLDSGLADAFYQGTRLPQAEVPWLPFSWQSHSVNPSRSPSCDERS